VRHTQRQVLQEDEASEDPKEKPQEQQSFPVFNFARRKKGHVLDCFCCTPVPDADGRLF
jgi:hypothetical protein